ncbi:MAG: hypothetical protein AB1568_01080 [Thermodesulfobacteriota bacterium]
MLPSEIERIIHGLAKKHGSGFELRARYLTESGKLRYRQGVFRQLTGDLLILENAEKGATVRLWLDRIVELRKKG